MFASKITLFCFYCPDGAERLLRKNLASHSKSFHGSLPPREKGQPSLFEYSQHVSKKRKIAKRFCGFDEVKEASCKRDRGAQEIFLHQNKVSLQDLPLSDLHQAWMRKHMPSLKFKVGGKPVSISNFIKQNKSKAQFFVH